MAIRKQRKAQWVYDCYSCGITTKPAVDLMGVYGARDRHLRSGEHTAAILKEAFQPAAQALTTLVDAYVEMGRMAMKSFTDLQDAFTLAPPPNLPHDPSLLRDRRKWGGK